MASAQFEVQAFRDKRWVIETVSANETDARLMAEKFLKQDNCSEVKIIQQTTGMVGKVREKEILHKTKEDNKKAPLQMSGRADQTAFCATLEECYALPARLSIMRLLRQFLDRFQITPTELLHSSTYLRKLADTDAILGAAIHQVGMAQGAKAGIDGKQRGQQLQMFFVQILERAKDYNLERKTFPSLRSDDYDYSYQRLRAAAPDKVDYNFLSNLSLHLSTYSARADKQNEILEHWKKASEEKVAVLLDGLAADCISFPEAVDDLFGRQANFLNLLKLIADLLYGRLQEETPEFQQLSPPLQTIAQKLAAKKAPQCYEVLLDRLLREVESEKPLDRRDLEAEEKLIKTLEIHLKDEDDNLLGGEPMKQALAGRRIRERKKKLRAMGMDDAADAL